MEIDTIMQVDTPRPKATQTKQNEAPKNEHGGAKTQQELDAARRAAEVRHFQQHEGGKNAPVRVSGRVREKCLERLHQRVDTYKAQARNNTANEHDVLGKFVNEKVITHWEGILSGNEALTNNDLMLIRTEVFDELFQKSVAVGTVVRREPGYWDDLKRIPIIGHLAHRPRTEETDRWFDTVVTTPEVRQWRERVRLKGWGAQTVRQELHDLSDLYARLGEATFISPRTGEHLAGIRDLIRPLSGFRHPLFEENTDSLDPFGFSRPTTDKFRSGIGEYIDRIITETPSLRDRNIRSIDQLYKDDPLEFVRVIYQAERSALGTMMDTEANAIVAEGNFRKNYKTDIEDNIARRNKPKLPNDEAEITDIQITDAEKRPTEIQLIITNLQTKITELETPYNTAKITLDSAKAEKKSVKDQISDIESQIKAREKAILGPAPKAPVGKKPSKAALDAYNKAIAKRAEAAGSMKDLVLPLQTKLTELQARLQAVDLEMPGKEAVVKTADAALDKKIITHYKDQLKERRKELLSAVKEIDELKRDRADQQTRLQEASAFDKRNIYGMKKNEIAADNLANIIEKLSKPSEYPDFGSDNLTNGRIEDIPGARTLIEIPTTIAAETIRKLVFDTQDTITDAAKRQETRYNGAKDWELLPDYLIARRLIDYLKVDPNRDLEIDMNASDTARRTELNTILRLRAEPKRTVAEEQQLQDLESQFQADGCALLSQVLPHLKTRSNFEQKDFIRYLIRQGVNDAANDKIFEIDPYHPPEVPVKEVGEGIARDGLGRIYYTDEYEEGEHGLHTQIFHQRDIVYECDKLQFTVPPGRYVQRPEGAVRVTLRTRDLAGPLSRWSVAGRVEIQANQTLAESLPPTRVAAAGMGWPQEVLDHFYNFRGAKQQNRADNVWINVPSVLGNYAQPMIATREGHINDFINSPMLNGVIPELNQNVRQSLGYYFTSLNNQQAAHEFRGFVGRTATIDNIFINGAYHTFQVRMDNDGRRWIRENWSARRNAAGGWDYGVAQPEIELQEFFQTELERTQQASGMQNLNGAWRNQLQQGFRTIEQTIGGEVIRVVESHRLRP